MKSNRRRRCVAASPYTFLSARSRRLLTTPRSPFPNTTQAFMNELLDVNFDVAKNWCTTGVGVMPKRFSDARLPAR